MGDDEAIHASWIATARFAHLAMTNQIKDTSS